MADLACKGLPVRLLSDARLTERGGGGAAPAAACRRARRGRSATDVTGFHLQASNGYEFLALAGAPPEGGEGWIGLFLLKGDRRSAVTLCGAGDGDAQDH